MKAIFNEANKDLYLCLVVYIASTKETEYVNNAAISYNKDIRKILARIVMILAFFSIYTHFYYFL